MELNRKKNLTEAEKLEERGLKRDFGFCNVKNGY